MAAVTKLPAAMPETNESGKVRGFLKKLFGRDGQNTVTEAEQQDALTEGISISTLLGSGKKPARNRIQIYQKYIEMVADPIISTALRMHVTAALGGHETSGDVVFIEVAADAKGDKQKEKYAQEISNDLSAIFNRVAYTVAFNGAGFGDGYGRVYTDGKNGVVDLYVDELVHPAMVQPYERANTTIGYIVATGQKATERLNVSQMVRMKMPRMVYIPQIRAVEKAIKQALREDDINALPMLPALVGGSFLDGAEDPFDALRAALVGLVGQRVLDSIDESMITVNQDGMTKDQQKQFMANITKILKASKERAEASVKSGKPLLQRFYHIIPTWGEKQMTALNGSITNGSGRGASGTISIEDVMFHAKLLAGALGIDLAMLGFSELLSGGLGDGGFFRTSAQSAERSRLLRVALTEFFNAVIDIHTYNRYGIVFPPNERPWQVNFYGTISALETERQRTKTESMNTGSILVQNLATMRDLDLGAAANEEILAKVMSLDEDQAKLLASSLKPPPDPNGMGGADGGGFGGGGDGFPPPEPEDPPGEPSYGRSKGGEE